MDKSQFCTFYVNVDGWEIWAEIILVRQKQGIWKMLANNYIDRKKGNHEIFSGIT